MPSLPNPWGILASVAFAAVLAVGAWFYRGHVDQLEWDAAIAKQEREAAEVLAKHDAEMSALNLKAEHDYSEHKAALDAKSSDLAALADELDRVRRAESGPRCGDKVRSAAVPAKSAPGDAGGNPGSFRELVEIAKLCVGNAAYAQQGHEWAVGLDAMTNKGQ